MEADQHDHDSTFGGDRDSLTSSTASLTSEVTKYQFQHGRRYHGYQAGKYQFPNDEKELDRMDLEHHNMRLQLDGKLHLCPLAEDPKEILDLGTGTGIWAMDMADEYPECQVLGTDLSPVQPTWTPPNCRFEIDDMDQEWTFGENRFDMIHHRYITGHVSNFPQFYKQVFEALKPGGSLEAVEIDFDWFSDDGTLSPDSALGRCGPLLKEAFASQGNKVPDASQFKQWITDAGFENVHLAILKRPSNDWPKDPKMKEIGRYCCLNWLEGMEAFTLAPLTRFLGWKPEEVTVFNAQMRSETVKRSIHAYMKGFICYGTKPLYQKPVPKKSAP